MKQLFTINGNERIHAGLWVLNNHYTSFWKSVATGKDLSLRRLSLITSYLRIAQLLAELDKELLTLEANVQTDLEWLSRTPQG